ARRSVPHRAPSLPLRPAARLERWARGRMSGPEEPKKERPAPASPIAEAVQAAASDADSQGKGDARGSAPTEPDAGPPAALLAEKKAAAAEPAKVAPAAAPKDDAAEKRAQDAT